MVSHSLLEITLRRNVRGLALFRGDLFRSGLVVAYARTLLRALIWLTVLSIPELAVSGESTRGLAIEPALSSDKGRARALLVGVNDYEQLNDLRYCEQDVTELANWLIEVGFPRRAVKCLTTADPDPANRPSYRNISERLDAVFSNLDEHCIVCIALSGHGGVFPIPETTDAGKESFFCPQDARLTEPASTMLSIQKVYDRLEKSRARFKLLIVDACRDPHFSPVGSRRAIDARESFSAFSKSFSVRDLPQATVAMVSCSSGEQSWEDPGLKRGIFIHYLLGGLSGKADTAHRGNQNGYVSYRELQDYVYRETSDHAFEKFDCSQTPQFYANYWELSNFEMVELPDRNESVPAPRVYSAWPFDVRDAKSRQKETAERIGHPIAFVDGMNMKFRLIPAGEFMMGSPKSEPDRRSDELQHHVRITMPFYLGCHEVTVAQFDAFVDDTGYVTEAEKDGGSFVLDLETGEYRLAADANWKHPDFTENPDLPVVCVTATDAVAYCKWAQRREGVQYRLPTEAEWEYACRTGSQKPWSCGSHHDTLGRFAHFGMHGSRDQSTLTPYPVGRLKKNAWGLYDTHGNVSEWCTDWYASGYYARSETDDPTGPEKGIFGVHRGGAWTDPPGGLRSAKRSSRIRTQSAFDLGFRVVREIAKGATRN